MLKWPAVKSPQETDYDFLNRIHSWALLIFRWIPDATVWKVPDLWPTKEELESVSDSYGVVTEDCDGFAQLCRYALAQSGIDSRLVICMRPGSRHCVAETKEGWVFDNTQPLLATWDSLLGLGYKKEIMGPICNPNDPYLTAPWHEAL